METIDTTGQPTQTSTPSKKQVNTDKTPTPNLRVGQTRRGKYTPITNRKTTRKRAMSTGSKEGAAPTKSAKTAGNMELLLQLKEYFDPKFDTVNDKVEELTTAVEDVNTTVTNLTGQVNRNSEDVRKMKIELEKQKKNRSDDIREEVLKIVKELDMQTPSTTSADVEKLGR